MAKKPDILIIQECENEHRLKLGSLVKKPDDFLWTGEKETKGIGIFSYSEYQLSIHEKYNAEYQYIIPIKLIGEQELVLLAIWAMQHKTKSKQSYIGQVWGAVNYYQSILKEHTIIIGDFNSNAIWDHSRTSGHHSDLVKFLEMKKIESIYHRTRKEVPGEEKEPSFYLYKDISKPYHLDYCFVSSDLMNDNTTIEVGKYDDWISYSDHMPIIIENLG